METLAEPLLFCQQQNCPLKRNEKKFFFVLVPNIKIKCHSAVLFVLGTILSIWENGNAWGNFSPTLLALTEFRIVQLNLNNLCVLTKCVC